MSTLSSSLDTREKLNVQSRSMPKPSLGMLYAISVPLAAGFVHLCEFRVGGLMVSGYVWMLMLAIGLLIFLLDNALTSRRRISFPWIAWMPFASFVWLSLVWGKVDRETIQAACQITMPIFVGVIVSVFVRSEEQLVLLLRAFRWSLVFLAAGFVVSYARVRGDLDGVGFRMGSLTCILIALIT